MRTTFLLVLFTLLFTACGGDETAAVEQATLEATRATQQSAYDAMMAGHDRVMPMMSKLTAAERSVNEALQADNLAPGRKDLLEAAMEQLEDANDGMMDWMENVKTLDELRAEMSNDAIATYLRQEAADIAKVEMDMTAAYANAQEVLGVKMEHSHDGHDHGHDGHDHEH